MNQQKKQFQRKIVYLVIAVVLLFPMYMLSRPATSGTAGRDGTPGGLLAQARSESDLSQADLGGIDPAGSAMKLSMLGLHGVASQVLWAKSHSYKDREDWTGYNAALEQITKLQPNFSSVWINQGHNLSYNISVEFDDYRDRFHYVIKGIELLKKGVRHNQRDPKLVNELAFYLGNKIGRSDEHVEFRELFRSPAYDDFYNTETMQGTLHVGRPTDPRLRDNWLVSNWWYEQAEMLIDKLGAPYKGLNPVVFFSNSPKAQMQHGVAIEEEGVFGERARQAWQAGSEAWDDFARRRLPSTLGFAIALGDLEKHRELEQGLLAELDALAPGVRDEIIAEKRAALTDQQRAALDKSPADRTPDEEEYAYVAERATHVSVEEVLQRIEEPATLEQARRLADRIRVQRERSSMIEKQRGVVNFEAWKTRSSVEQLPSTLAAREAIYQGDQAYQESNLSEALNLYNKGIYAWSETLEQYPEMLGESAMIHDMIDMMKKYQTILGQNNQPPPSPFPLQSVIDVYFARGMHLQEDQPLRSDLIPPSQQPVGLQDE
ncbi:MAG: hypothetical protein WEA31_03405 [Pirellulales bacterium]